MKDALLFHFAHGFEKHLHDGSSLFVVDLALILLQIRLQSHAFDILCDDVQGVVGLVDSEELHDVGVGEFS